MSDKLPKKTEPELQKTVEAINIKAGTPQVKHYTAAPLPAQVAKGSHATALIGGTYYLYFNVNGVMKRVQLT